MKKADIKVGERYTDNKGGVRLVVAEGPEYVLYSGQAEADNLRFQVLAKKRGPHMPGSYHNSTRASFAAWAKSRIVP